MGCTGAGEMIPNTFLQIFANNPFVVILAILGAGGCGS